jgi:hypothetical protein
MDALGPVKSARATDSDITCQVLQLALATTRLRMACYAGELDAHTAMNLLDVAGREIRSVHTR